MLDQVQKFKLPAGLIGRFAVVKLWPEIKAAEDECIARIKIAATALGLECIEIHADGSLIDDPTITITKQDVDFVFHLHYDTPKDYDIFSFVALWNPLRFYHEWGYERCSRNLLSHDDFLSCSSPAADDHVARVVRRTSTHLPPFFNLYHSLADVVHAPSLGDYKLFYAGINWEALGKGKSRHQDLLKLLDKTGELRIYGPTEFLGVKVWDGYDSYVREIPFDGISMMDEISKAGIALVLSSPAHKESELMSSRLFESVASGALIICDENNFAKKFFGDSLLYIDTRCSADEICESILKHLAWAKAHADDALKMIAKAQEIFKQKFTLQQNLKNLYLGFLERKQALLDHQRAKENNQSMKVGLYLLFPEYSEDILDTHIASVTAQEYKNFSAILVIDRVVTYENREKIQERLTKSTVPIEVLEVEFFAYSSLSENKARRNLGKVVLEIINKSSQLDAIVFVAPNEKIFSNHLQILANSLLRNPDKNCAATAMIIKHSGEPIKHPVKSVYERIHFAHFNPFLPDGYARFIFRISAFPADINLALSYLDRKALAALIGENKICQELPATVVIDINMEFPSGAWNEGQENAVICDMFPKAFTFYRGYEPALPYLPMPQNEVHKNLFKVTGEIIYYWFVAQTRALRKEGLIARFGAMKRKFNRRLTELKQVI